MVVEWQSKLHDKGEEMKLAVQKFEQKLKSLQAELEERDQILGANRNSLA